MTARGARSTGLFAVLVCLSGSACSALTSFSSLTGDAPASEAGASDAAVDRATLDSPTEDSGGPHDGSTTSTDAGDAGCRFCDDFDNRATIAGNWTDVTGNGVIQSTVYKSPPNAALLHIDAVTQSGSSSNLVLQLPLVGGAVTIDYDFKLASDVSGHTGNMNIFGMSDGNYLGAIAPASGVFYLDDWLNFPDGGHRQDGFSTSMTRVDQQWHHLHYDVVYAPVGGRFHVVIDSETVVDEENFGTYGGATSPPKISISIGIYAGAQSPAVDVYIDNVEIH